MVSGMRPATHLNAPRAQQQDGFNPPRASGRLPEQRANERTQLARYPLLDAHLQVLHKGLGAEQACIAAGAAPVGSVAPALLA